MLRQIQCFGRPLLVELLDTHVWTVLLNLLPTHLRSRSWQAAERHIDHEAALELVNSWAAFLGCRAYRGVRVVVEKEGCAPVVTQ